MFTTRILENGDAEMANEWLSGWKYNPIPLSMYPNTGLVLLNDNLEPIFIGFVWVTNSSAAILGFITRNPFIKKIPKDTRKRFCKSLDEYARLDLGFVYVCTWADNKFLVEDFKDLGFRETSNKCSELINYKL